MKEFAAGTAALGLAFSLVGNPVAAQKQELTPQQKEQIAVAQFCHSTVSSALSDERGTATKYLTQGCQMTYYAAKNLLTLAKK